jgi:hypothetical protein
MNSHHEARETVLSDAMDAPSVYVAMTRGSQSNTVHIVAADLAQARAKRVDAAGRNRADLGLDHAITAARAEAGDYAPVRQETFGQRMARRMAAIDEQLTAARQAPATQPAVPARSRRLNRRRATPSGTADRGSDGTTPVRPGADIGTTTHRYARPVGRPPSVSPGER